MIMIRRVIAASMCVLLLAALCRADEDAAVYNRKMLGTGTDSVSDASPTKNPGIAVGEPNPSAPGGFKPPRTDGPYDGGFPGGKGFPKGGWFGGGFPGKKPGFPPPREHDPIIRIPDCNKGPC